MFRRAHWILSFYIILFLFVVLSVYLSSFARAGVYGPVRAYCALTFFGSTTTVLSRPPSLGYESRRPCFCERRAVYLASSAVCFSFKYIFGGQCARFLRSETGLRHASELELSKRLALILQLSSSCVNGCCGSSRLTGLVAWVSPRSFLIYFTLGFAFEKSQSMPHLRSWDSIIADLNVGQGEQTTVYKNIATLRAPSGISFVTRASEADWRRLQILLTVT